MNEHAAARQQFCELLKAQGKRQFIAISGDAKWARQYVQDWLEMLGQDSHARIYANTSLTHCQSFSSEQIPLLLGRECEHFVFDAMHGFDPNHLGIIGGMLTAGGLLFFLLPQINQWQENDSLYLRFFVTRLLEDERCLFIDQKAADQENTSFQNSVKQLQQSTNTDWPDFEEQRLAVDALKKVIHSQRRSPTVILADRGRGKSAALGIAASELLDEDISHVAVTSQSKQSAATVFKHIAPSYQQTDTAKKAQYFRIDDLLQAPVKTDLVLVDEAASIPLPQLYKLIKLYPRIAFASTVHGYEGSGRGFMLHFTQILDKHCRNWRRVDLQTPIRWQKDDPLEGFLFRVLMLDADINNETQYTESQRQNLAYKKLTANELYRDENTLRQLFGLLTLAHYRTKPRDLKTFLNQKHLQFYCAIEPESGTFIGACLAHDEGEIDAASANLIASGKHRPKGHVLPQTLSMQSGIHSTLCMPCSRIIRIVVHPKWQRHGIGSTLLQYSVKKMPHKALIGSSFSMAHDILHFWYKNDFRPVRIGSKARTASAMQHAIYLYQHTPKALEITDKLQQDLQAQWPFLCSTVLQQTPPLLLADILIQLPAPPPISNPTLNALFAFAYLNRPAESCIQQLQQAVLYMASNHPKIDLSSIEKAIYFLSQQHLWQGDKRSKKDTQTVKNLIKDFLKKTAEEFTYLKLRQVALREQ